MRLGMFKYWSFVFVFFFLDFVKFSSASLNVETVLNHGYCGKWLLILTRNDGCYGVFSKSVGYYI